jgi:hypothetical protein
MCDRHGERAQSPCKLAAFMIGHHLSASDRWKAAIAATLR